MYCLYDVIVIGAGPAGIKLSINLKQKGLAILLFEKGAPGGKVNIAPRVDNYPNHKPISGPDLAYEFYNEMQKNDINLKSEEIIEVFKKDGVFTVISTENTYYSKYVVAASGTLEKKLEVENEDYYFGKGLSYCAICDGHFFKNKIVAVVSEDKYAINEAIYLSSVAKEVIMITKLSHLKGDQRNLNELYSKNNVSYLYNQNIIKLLGIDKLEGALLKNNKKIFIDGIFPLVGYIPNTSFLPTKLLDKDGFVKTINYETSISGLYAIGDVLSRELKQIYLAEIDAKKVSEIILSKYTF